MPSLTPYIGYACLIALETFFLSPRWSQISNVYADVWYILTHLSQRLQLCVTLCVCFPRYYNYVIPSAMDTKDSFFFCLRFSSISNKTDWLSNGWHPVFCAVQSQGCEPPKLSNDWLTIYVYLLAYTNEPDVVRCE